MGMVPPFSSATRPALDFLNSIATPAHCHGRLDRRRRRPPARGWRRRGSCPRETLELMRAQALPGELDTVAHKARDLREWFRGSWQEHKGRPLVLKNLDELTSLNRLLARDEMFSRITLQPEKEAGLARPSDGAPLAIAGSAAASDREALARFVSTEDFSHVKACEGPACTLLFADHGRGRARRWCSMAICGNRAKQATHRKRLRTQEPVGARR